MKLHKNKTHLMLAIFGLIILSLVLFCVVPLLLEIEKVSGDLALAKKDTALLGVQFEKIEDFKKVYGGYKSDLDKINALFVDPQNPVGFIKFLEDSAGASQIKPKISLAPNLKDLSIVSFQISASEDFSNILDFSKKLENGPYLVQIQSIVMKNATDTVSKESTPGKVDAIISINVFAKQ